MEVINKNDMSYHEDTELRLGLPGYNNQVKKRAFADISKEATFHVQQTCDDFAPPKKMQPIGWPPVKSCRKNFLQPKNEEASGMYVKVSMDGAPYLRKIDLKLYKDYKEIVKAMEDMFQLKAGMLSKRSKNFEDSGSEYKLTYEDKDGDWMLVGDVPWEMFISSCRRLRIMKGSGTN